MKRTLMIKAVTIGLLFGMCLTNAYAGGRHGHRHGDRHHDRYSGSRDGGSSYDGWHSNTYDEDCKPSVGAPLDGGLLTLLVGGGIAFVARRKKKIQE